MKFLSLAVACSCAALLACAPPPLAADEKAPAKTDVVATVGADKLSEKETKFVKESAAGGLMEVKLGEVAKSNAASAEVKAFGEKMVADHSKANEDLKAVAEKKGITLPPDLEGPHKGMYDRMAKLNGEAFDKAYVPDMLKDHRKDVAEFEAMSKSTKDSELKGFIDKTLPVLKEHLAMIEKLSKSRGGAAKK